MAFRAFVGIPVPPEPALTDLLEGLRSSGSDVKVVEPQNLHLTVSFLGNVPDEAAEPLAQALRRGVAGFEPFALDLRGVGAFPNVRRPRVVWVGVEDAKPVTDLALGVRRALEMTPFGAIEEKAFRAHVTLARTRSTQGLDHLVRFLQEHGRDPLPKVDVREVRLYRSTLSPQGPTYETLASAALEG